MMLGRARGGDRAQGGARRPVWGGDRAPGAGAGAGQGPRGGEGVKDPAGDRARGGCDSRMSPQAKYLAQIILVGAQVVGRAFMRALRQEFAGRSRAAAPGVRMPPRVWSVPALPCPGLGIAQHPHPLPQGNPLLPVPWGCARRGPLPGLSQGDSHHTSPDAGLMEFQLELGSQQPSQAPARIRHCCQAPRSPGSPKGQSGDGPPGHSSPSPALLASACLQPSSLWAPTANRSPPSRFLPPSQHWGPHPGDPRGLEAA